YFLFATTQEQVDFLRFPLGEMSKREVREHAAAMGLAVAAKQDSQDICFVPQGRYTDLVSRLNPGAAREGEIVHLDGRVLGRHEGVGRYPVGQRRGIGVATGDPLYVVHVDAPNARVVVGPREALETRRVHLREVNWLGDAPLAEGFELEVHARVRSTRPPSPARLRVREGRASVEFAHGEPGVAPGQACVLYSEEGAGARIYGGGFIDRAEHADEVELLLRRLQENGA